jgi:hypothetical protein
VDIPFGGHMGILPIKFVGIFAALLPALGRDPKGFINQLISFSA